MPVHINKPRNPKRKKKSNAGVMIIHKGTRRPSKVMPPNRPSGAAVQELVLWQSKS